MEAFRRKRLYGRKGFTRGAEEVLRPYVDADGGDFVSFDLVPRDVMLRAAGLLPERQRSDRQNEAPSLGELLEDPLAVYYGGYIIRPPRWDERVTLDTVYYPATPEGYRQAAEVIHRHRPDEFVPVREDGRDLLRLWWD